MNIPRCVSGKLNKDTELVCADPGLLYTWIRNRGDHIDSCRFRELVGNSPALDQLKIKNANDLYASRASFANRDADRFVSLHEKASSYLRWSGAARPEHPNSNVYQILTARAFLDLFNDGDVPFRVLGNPEQCRYVTVFFLADIAFLQKADNPKALLGLDRPIRNLFFRAAKVGTLMRRGAPDIEESVLRPTLETEGFTEAYQSLAADPGGFGNFLWPINGLSTQEFTDIFERTLSLSVPGVAAQLFLLTALLNETNRINFGKDSQFREFMKALTYKFAAIDSPSMPPAYRFQKLCEISQPFQDQYALSRA